MRFFIDCDKIPKSPLSSDAGGTRKRPRAFLFTFSVHRRIILEKYI